MGNSMRWVTSVTTVPSRRATTLPLTLATMEAAGFPPPRLFVDGGGEDAAGWRDEFCGSGVTVRDTPVGCAGNWVLALAETFARHPDQEFYLVAQDDAVFPRNLRKYLERTLHQGNGTPKGVPQKGYCNLYLGSRNVTQGPIGWHRPPLMGHGAVALVFGNDCVTDLLCAPDNIWGRFRNPSRRTTNIDGGIHDALKSKGWAEYCHRPSLVWHAGGISTMCHQYGQGGDGWMGERWDVMELLGKMGV